MSSKPVNSVTSEDISMASDTGRVVEPAFTTAIDKLDNKGASEHSVVAAWHLLSPEEASLVEIEGTRADVPGKTMVMLDTDTIRNLAPGDSVQFDLPQSSRVFRLQVSHADQLPSGNFSIRGKIDDNPLLDFVMTISDRATLATIGTVEGVFNLRGNAKHAWIVRARQYNHHVDPSILDYRLPSEARSLTEGENS